MSWTKKKTHYFNYMDYDKTMNNEKYNQIIDDCYANYVRNFSKYVDSLPQNGEVEFIINRDKFINKIKTDKEFSEKWGLSIEERELSVKERIEMIQPFGMDALIPDVREKWMKENNIPTKLITITYNNETVEVYEN